MKVVQKPGDRFPITLRIDQDTMLPVAHRTTKPMGSGESVDKWAKTDPLDHPFDHDAATGSVSRLRECD